MTGHAYYEASTMVQVPVAEVPQRPRVRLVREAGAAVWRVERG